MSEPDWREIARELAEALREELGYPDMALPLTWRNPDHQRAADALVEYGQAEARPSAAEATTTETEAKPNEPDRA